MKLYKSMMLCGAMFLGAFALTGCSDDEETYDFPGIDYERLYMQNPNSTEKGSAVYNNILELLNVSFGGKVAVTTTAPVKNAVHVKLAIDNSLVAEYNQANGTRYEALPEGIVSLSQTDMVVGAGKNCSDSIDVVLDESKCLELTDGATYVVPVTIVSTDAEDVRLARDSQFRSRFFTLSFRRTNSIFLENGSSSADLIGKQATDKSLWTCVDAVNLDPAGFPNLLAGGWSARWDLLDTSNKTAPISFTIDLGEKKSVSGFNATCYIAKSFNFSLSTDGNTWLDLGSTDGVGTVYDDNWNSWYGLAAAMPARYVKVDITTDPDSWYWQYASWGYCSVRGFELLMAE